MEPRVKLEATGNERLTVRIIGPVSQARERTEESDCGSSPVFVVGSPRSGTTLLYSVLMASGEFPTYEAESRILECSTRYGSLRRRRNFERFARDYRNSRQFARSGLDEDEFFSEAIARCTDYADFLRLFMQRICASQGKSRWAEKTPNHLLYVRELMRAFPDARFLHAVRDGRDVALSQRAVGMTRRYSRDPLAQLVWGGKVWEGLVRIGRREQQRAPDRFLEIRYEDVVGDLTQVLNRISSFLEIELSEDVIRSARVGSLGSANTVLAMAEQRDTRGVDAGAVERWRSQLDDREVRVLNWAIGDTLSQFGYPVAAASGLPSGDYLLGLHALLAPPALRGKRWLNRRTPVGRYAQVPLELGLT